MVAKSPIVTPTSSPPGFARSRATIARDRSIPCTGDSTLREWERDPARPDPELERAPAPRQLREQVDGRVDDRRVEHLLELAGLVVPRGDALVEVAVLAEHGRNVPQ